MKTIFQYRFWKLGRNLLIASSALFFVVAIAASLLGSPESEALDYFMGSLAIVFLIGASIVWLFAIRFYFANNLSFGVLRSAIYLMLLLSMNWISPFIFIAVEGRNRFFNQQIEKETEQVGDGDAEEAV